MTSKDVVRVRFRHGGRVTGSAGLRCTAALLCIAIGACERSNGIPVAEQINCPPPSHLTAQGSLSTGTRILATAAVYERSRCVPEGIRKFWGSTDIPVEHFIGDLSISVGPNEVWVPLSSHIDLGDPRSITIEDVTSSSFLVVVRGMGDSGYTARLQVEGANVISRRLFNAAFEAEAGETAHYSYPNDW